MSSAFLYDAALTRNILREDHVLRPVRLRYVYELLDAYGVFSRDDVELLAPRVASADELQSFHDADYVQAVQAFSTGDRLGEMSRYNFSNNGDNTISEGMYEAAALAVGASLVGAETVRAGQPNAAFNAGGGFHHAMQGKAYGFCIFNDPVIAIQALLREGLRVVYVDIDAHHGDGVQNAFYDTDQVLTISLHESGRYLFPGTGSVEEVGMGAGKGYAVNVPLAPRTSDDTYLRAFREVVPPLVQAFKPDVLTTQLGIDTHSSDPLTHLALTTSGFQEAVRELKALSPGQWVAFGGGGYDISAVARCWSLAFAVMAGIDLNNAIPEPFAEKYGLRQLYDPPLTIDADARNNAKRMAEESIEEVKRVIFPVHGL